MSEAQALRDKLTAVQKEIQQVKAELDKQRAQHTREQESLQRALDTTRQEASLLRKRLEPLENPSFE
jgi:predicted  nucleic acid-binding Zn-ribbon protein